MNYLVDFFAKVTPANILLIIFVFILLIFIFLILIAHRKFPQLIDRFITAKEFSFKISPTSLEAKVLGQLEDAIDFEFTDNKSEIKELISHELKSLFGEIRRESTGINLRSNERVIVEEPINIITESGKVLEVIMLDQSKNGLRFSCTSKLKRKEIFRINTVAAIIELPFPLPECLEIVRGVKASKGHYVYGAKIIYNIQ